MKYDRLIDLEYDDSPLVDGENLLWRGKPKKSCFMISNILAMMPIALIWIAFDGFMIKMMFSEMTSEFKYMAPFLGLFFAVHLMPVWIWLSNIITANRRWKNTEYYITDKRVIIKNGLFSGNYETVYYKEIKSANIHIGLTDKLFGVGDIYIKTSGGMMSFLDIVDADKVYPRIQKIIMDMQTDIEFPNAYRPKNNPGYNTKLDTDETKE